MLRAYTLHDPQVRYFVSTTTYISSMDKQLYPMDISKNEVA